MISSKGHSITLRTTGSIKTKQKSQHRWDQNLHFPDPLAYSLTLSKLPKPPVFTASSTYKLLHVYIIFSTSFCFASFIHYEPCQKSLFSLMRSATPLLSYYSVSQFWYFSPCLSFFFSPRVFQWLPGPLCLLVTCLNHFLIVFIIIIFLFGQALKFITWNEKTGTGNQPKIIFFCTYCN